MIILRIFIFIQTKYKRSPTSNNYFWIVTHYLIHFPKVAIVFIFFLIQSFSNFNQARKQNVILRSVSAVKRLRLLVNKSRS